MFHLPSCGSSPNVSSEIRLILLFMLKFVRSVLCLLRLLFSALLRIQILSFSAVSQDFPECRLSVQLLEWFSFLEVKLFAYFLWPAVPNNIQPAVRALTTSFQGLSSNRDPGNEVAALKAAWKPRCYIRSELSCEDLSRTEEGLLRYVKILALLRGLWE